MPRGLPLDPETAIAVKLNAIAGRRASDMTPPREAAAELREIAGKHTDLLAQTAGTMLGALLGRPGASRPETLLAVGYLMLAGAEPKATVAAAQDAAVRIAKPMQSTVNRTSHTYVKIQPKPSP